MWKNIRNLLWPQLSPEWERKEKPLWKNQETSEPVVYTTREMGRNGGSHVALLFGCTSFPSLFRVPKLKPSKHTLKISPDRATLQLTRRYLISPHVLLSREDTESQNVRFEAALKPPQTAVERRSDRPLTGCLQTGVTSVHGLSRAVSDTFKSVDRPRSH